MPNAKPPEKPDLFVVVRMLECLWRERKSMVKTHLQRAANVNWDVFSRYLTWLHDRNLVFFEGSKEGHEFIGISRKGLEAYRRLVEWLNEFVHGSRP